MGQRTRSRGHGGTWKIVSSHPGPPGSGLHATLFVQEDGSAQCGDVEQAVGARSKRRLVRLEGPGAHERALAWMDGFYVGSNPPPPAVQQASTKNRKKT